MSLALLILLYATASDSFDDGSPLGPGQIMEWLVECAPPGGSYSEVVRREASWPYQEFDVARPAGSLCRVSIKTTLENWSPPSPAVVLGDVSAPPSTPGRPTSLSAIGVL